MDITKTVIKDVCGIRNDGNSKGSMSMQFYIGNSKTSEIKKTVDTVLTLEPFYKIERHGKYVQVDVLFRDHLHEDMKKIWECLENYGKTMEEMHDDPFQFPMVTLCMVPIESPNNYYIRLFRPLFWSLQPQFPGGECNMVRLIFDMNDFAIIEITQ